ncbi:MAG: tetratricopeptide repeat protein [Bdellovibrionales bacterium]|nr:tetratricopeptide repeat protein [Bdellovibrionales bacterium]
MRGFCFSIPGSLIFVLAFAIGGPALAQDLEAYQKGLSLYQEKDYESAAEAFSKSLDADPQNPYVLYNWGLSQYELGKNGLAFAAWRKALNLKPTLISVSRAIDQLIKTRPLPGRRAPQGHWEVFRSSALIYLPEGLLAVVTALFLCAGGWLMIRFFAERKIAVEEELPLPNVPWLGVVFVLFFLAFQTLSLAKFYESGRTRGVVIAESVPMRSAPSETGPELFKIAEGAEVIVIRRENEWLQIRYPSGLAGWVPENSVFQTTSQEI